MKKLTLFVTPLVLLLTCMLACTPKKESERKDPIAKVTTAGNAGNFIRIKGNGFSTNKLENTVVFGDVKAAVLYASNNYLLVQVPPHKAGVVPVTVTVGDAPSNSLMFEYNSNAMLAANLPLR